MNYQTVSSTNEGRDGLISTFGATSLMLFCLQFLIWVSVYDSGVELISWQGVGLAGLAGIWLTITFLYFTFKKGQGTQTMADFGHGLVAVKHGDNWGVFSAELQKLFLPFEFTSIRAFSRDRYGKPKYLELTNKDGLVSLYSLSEWRMIIPPQFKEIVMHGGNLCSVQGEDGWGVWSLKMDKLVMPTKYPGYKVWDRCHDFVGVPNGSSEGRKWAVFSFADQRVVTPYISDNIDYFGNGVFKLQKGQRKRRSDNYHLRFGLYLHGPRVVIKPIYRSIKEFEPGLLELQDGGLRGLISVRTGKFVAPVAYRSIRRLSDDEIEVHNGQNQRTVNLRGLKTA